MDGSVLGLLPFFSRGIQRFEVQRSVKPPQKKMVVLIGCDHLQTTRTCWWKSSYKPSFARFWNAGSAFQNRERGLRRVTHTQLYALWGSRRPALVHPPVAHGSGSTGTLVNGTKDYQRCALALEQFEPQPHP